MVAISNGERKLQICDAVETLAAWGFKLSPATIYRHGTKGVVGFDGQRRYLKLFKAGRKVLTSESALREFYEGLSKHPAEVAVPESPEFAAQHQAAERALSKAGV